ncbi:MAG TPA: aminotransferase class III-fold pyridoxal phosphate-dependent enzyme [Acidimicrobiales bacterium]|nr:aminotransferase class III-fold pyridoxal phosphate-dependent enzyme [Acidimicrobiales bacterium]
MSVTPFLHPFAKPTATDFITIVRGEGAAVFDREGRRYVDGLASLWYCNVGHGRQEVIDAVTRQIATLEDYNTFDIFTNEPAEEIAALVSALSPVPDARVFLTCSGSEAVDTALKLARLTFSRSGQPQRQLLVGRTLAYHGVNFGGVSVQGLPLNQEGWGDLLGPVAQIDHDDLASAESLFDRHGDEIAAVIAEPVIGAGGVYPATVEYLRGLRKFCDEAGALLIFDEVITGFGRLGSWFASEHYGVTPDMITFAKAVTSGYQPLGGVIVGPRVREAIEADPDFILRHGYTYSGHPTACAAAVANIEVLRDDGLLGRVPHIAARLGDGFAQLADEGLVAGVRGEGAIWALAMHPTVSALDVRQGLLERGVIARPIGTAALAFCPPLVIGDDDLELCVSATAASLRDVAG